MKVVKSANLPRKEDVKNERDDVYSYEYGFGGQSCFVQVFRHLPLF